WSVTGVQTCALPISMTPCTGCGCHVLDAERTCPHCGVALRGRSAGATRAAALLSLAVVACTGGTKSNSDSGTSITTYGVDYGARSEERRVGKEGRGR